MQIHPEHLNKKNVEFDFDPLFYVLDKKTKWVMAVREQDKYEMKGTYISYHPEDTDKWKHWPACKNVQDPMYHEPDFILTKNKFEAIEWAIVNYHLPDTQDVVRTWTEDAPSM